MSLRAGELAVVVKGLWPNVGRVVFVDRFVECHDFTAMGLGHMAGWRVRSWGHGPLDTVSGPRFSGYTPRGSLKPLGPLPPDQAHQLQRDMALADFREAMQELAEVLQRESATQPHRHATRDGRRRAPARRHAQQALSLT